MQAFLRERRALHVRVGFYLLGQLGALFAPDGRQVLLLKRLYRVGVVAQVDLGATEHDGRVRTVVSYFRYPFVGDVGECARTDDAEADEKHVRLGIGQRPESIVVLLTSRVPEAQANCYVVDDDR